MRARSAKPLRARGCHLSEGDRNQASRARGANSGRTSVFSVVVGRSLALVQTHRSGENFRLNGGENCRLNRRLSPDKNSWGLSASNFLCFVSKIHLAEGIGGVGGSPRHPFLLGEAPRPTAHQFPLARPTDGRGAFPFAYL